MKDIFQILSERKILEALEKGEFEDLPGKGKPLEFNDNHIPRDVRMLYKVMRNAGLQPDEVALKKEIEALKEQLKTTTDEKERVILKRKIADKQLHFDVLMDRRRGGR